MMENYDVCFRNSENVIIDKISFCATYCDALKILSLMTIGYSEKHCPVHSELNIGEKHIAFYDMNVR